MSTRSVIARTTGEGTFKGVYHRWDGYPTSLGATLANLLASHFKDNPRRMLAVLIDEHPAGWSTINGADFTKTPGFGGAKDRPHCFCHGDRHEPAQPIDEKTDCGAEWAYVFDEEQNVLHVCRMICRDGAGTEKVAPGMFGFGARAQYWQEVARIELQDIAKVGWAKIKCGENLERCGHYAWVHFPKMKGSNLGTQTYLGNWPLEFHDAIAFIAHGKRFATTGCGHRSGDVWIATVARGGERTDMLVAMITRRGYVPYPGVTWVYPPTRVNPNETLVWDPGVVAHA